MKRVRLKMLVEKTNSYISTRRKLIKRRRVSEEAVEIAEQLLEYNHLDSSLDFKKIICKKDKFRRSIKIANTQ